MDIQQIVELLEKEWGSPDGFLSLLREGVFDRTGFERFEQVLKSIHLDNRKPFDRRFVALTWYAPVFMSWQRERVEENGGQVDELEVAITKIQNLVEELLGVP